MTCSKTATAKVIMYFDWPLYYNIYSKYNFVIKKRCRYSDCCYLSMYFYLFSCLAFAQIIQTQAFPQTVIYKENDLVIVCSFTNPTQLNSVFYMELLKNSSTTFETVVSVATGQTPKIQWKDTQLQGRATAIGNVDSPSSAQLRLKIDKNSVQCPTDFKMYMCKMSGFSATPFVVSRESNPITISFVGIQD